MEMEMEGEGEEETKQKVYSQSTKNIDLNANLHLDRDPFSFAYGGSTFREFQEQLNFENALRNPFACKWSVDGHLGVMLAERAFILDLKGRNRGGEEVEERGANENEERERMEETNMQVEMKPEETLNESVNKESTGHYFSRVDNSYIDSNFSPGKDLLTLEADLEDEILSNLNLYHFEDCVLDEGGRKQEKKSKQRTDENDGKDRKHGKGGNDRKDEKDGEDTEDGECMIENKPYPIKQEEEAEAENKNEKKEQTRKRVTPDLTVTKNIWKGEAETIYNRFELHIPQCQNSFPVGTMELSHYSHPNVFNAFLNSSKRQENINNPLYCRKRSHLKNQRLASPDEFSKLAISGRIQNDKIIVKGLDWSPIGCAWNGGCVVAVSTDSPGLYIYEPSFNDQSMEWPLLTNMSRIWYNSIAQQMLREKRGRVPQGPVKIPGADFVKWKEMYTFTSIRWYPRLVSMVDKDGDIMNISFLAFTSLRSIAIYAFGTFTSPYYIRTQTNNILKGKIIDQESLKGREKFQQLRNSYPKQSSFSSSLMNDAQPAYLVYNTEISKGITAIEWINTGRNSNGKDFHLAVGTQNGKVVLFRLYLDEVYLEKQTYPFIRFLQYETKYLITQSDYHLVSLIYNIEETTKNWFASIKESKLQLWQLECPHTKTNDQQSRTTTDGGIHVHGGNPIMTPHGFHKISGFESRPLYRYKGQSSKNFNGDQDTVIIDDYVDFEIWTSSMNGEIKRWLLNEHNASLEILQTLTNDVPYIIPKHFFESQSSINLHHLNHSLNRDNASREDEETPGADHVQNQTESKRDMNKKEKTKVTELFKSVARETTFPFYGLCISPAGSYYAALQYLPRESQAKNGVLVSHQKRKNTENRAMLLITPTNLSSFLDPPVQDRCLMYSSIKHIHQNIENSFRWWDIGHNIGSVWQRQNRISVTPDKNEKANQKVGIHINKHNHYPFDSNAAQLGPSFLNSCSNKFLKADYSELANSIVLDVEYYFAKKISTRTKKTRTIETRTRTTTKKPNVNISSGSSNQTLSLRQGSDIMRSSFPLQSIIFSLQTRISPAATELLTRLDSFLQSLEKLYMKEQELPGEMQREDQVELEEQKDYQQGQKISIVKESKTLTTKKLKANELQREVNNLVDKEFEDPKQEAEKMFLDLVVESLLRFPTDYFSLPGSTSFAILQMKHVVYSSFLKFSDLLPLLMVDLYTIYSNQTKGFIQESYSILSLLQYKEFLSRSFFPKRENYPSSLNIPPNNPCSSKSQSKVKINLVAYSLLKFLKHRQLERKERKEQKEGINLRMQPTLTTLWGITIENVIGDIERMIERVSVTREEEEEEKDKDKEREKFETIFRCSLCSQELTYINEVYPNLANLEENIHIDNYSTLLSPIEEKERIKTSTYQEEEKKKNKKEKEILSQREIYPSSPMMGCVNHHLVPLCSYTCLPLPILSPIPSPFWECPFCHEKNMILLPELENCFEIRTEVQKGIKEAIATWLPIPATSVNQPIRCLFCNIKTTLKQHT